MVSFSLFDIFLCSAAVFHATSYFAIVSFVIFSINYFAVVSFVIFVVSVVLL